MAAEAVEARSRGVAEAPSASLEDGIGRLGASGLIGQVYQRRYEWKTGKEIPISNIQASERIQTSSPKAEELKGTGTSQRPVQFLALALAFALFSWLVEEDQDRIKSKEQS